jgi:hypothetical protein
MHTTCNASAPKRAERDGWSTWERFCERRMLKPMVVLTEPFSISGKECVRGGILSAMACALPKTQGAHAKSVSLSCAKGSGNMAFFLRSGQSDCSSRKTHSGGKSNLHILYSIFYILYYRGGWPLINRLRSTCRLDNEDLKIYN